MIKKSFYFIISTCLICLMSSKGFTQSVYFDDTQGNEIRIGNDYLELMLRKSNGSISSIVDKTMGQVLSQGNAEEHLWSAEFVNAGGLGGRDYAERWNCSFNYAWDTEDGQLTLSFKPDPNTIRQLTVSVLLTISDDSFFDLQLDLANTYNDTLLFVHLPHNLLFKANEMREAVFPVLPGIRFNEQFFQQHCSWNHGHYSRNTVFADYAYFRLSSGQLAMYAMLHEDVTPNAWRRIYYYSNNDAYIWSHSYRVIVLHGDNWKSPTVRIHIGKGAISTAEAYRVDTGLASTPSIREKLGELYDKLSSALSSKFGPRGMLNDFGFNMTEYTKCENLWQSLPGPSLLWLVDWPRRGQDESNPDVFPVDPSIGTDHDFRIVLEAAREAGHIIMPYINPTFWDDESETAQSLELEDYVHMVRPGQPLYEVYSGHAGYAVCPYAPAVIDRLARLMEDLTTKITSDLIWEDQIGSRHGLDYNKHMPNPLYHAQGWLEHVRCYQHLRLMAEHGHDRQVETHVGFQGNLLLYEPGGDFGDSEWGAGNWEYFPIVPIMARDKIFFYMAPDQPIDSKQRLSWTLAMGQIPSFLLNGGTYNTLWHKTAQAFQQHVVSRFANERMTNYTWESEEVTRSRFESYDVLTNWSKTTSLAVQNHEISREGFLITNDALDLIAGVFTHYNDQDLSSGDHYIIETRYVDSLVVRHPQGNETPLRLGHRSLGDKANIRCYGITKDVIFEAMIQVDSHYVSFNLNRYHDDQEITRYVVTSEPIYLTAPLILEPSNCVTVVLENLTLRWQIVEGASSYQVQISQDNKFASDIIDIGGIKQTEYTPEALNTGTTYFWRVRAFNESRTSTWSTIRRFRVAGINIADRLVAFYPFDGNPNDFAGSADGTLNGNVTLAPDRFDIEDRAYSFDGNDDSIVFPESEAFTSIDREITVSAWVYPNSLEFETGVMMRDRFWRLFFYEDGSVVGNIFNENGNENRVASTSKVSLSTWAHVAFTYDGQNIVVYLNGERSGALKYPCTRIGQQGESSIPVLGATFGLSQNDFNGIIDDVRIYDRALSSEEMAELYRLTPTLVNQDDKENIPAEYFLNQNYPNPFNPSTTIFYQLPESGEVKLSIYNVTGQLVETLVNEQKKAGSHSVIWDAKGMVSGLYFYKITAGNYSASKKCAFLK